MAAESIQEPIAEHIRTNLRHVLKLEGWDVAEFTKRICAYVNVRHVGEILGLKGRNLNKLRDDPAPMPVMLPRLCERLVLHLMEDQLSLPPKEFEAAYEPVSTRVFEPPSGVLASFRSTRSSKEKWRDAAAKYGGNYIVYYQRPSANKKRIVAAYLWIGPQEAHGIAARLIIPFGKRHYYDYDGVCLPLDERLYFFTESVVPHNRTELLSIILDGDDWTDEIEGHMIGIDAKGKRSAAVYIYLEQDNELTPDNALKSLQKDYKLGERAPRDPRIPDGVRDKFRLPRSKRAKSAKERVGKRSRKKHL